MMQLSLQPEKEAEKAMKAEKYLNGVIINMTNLADNQSAQPGGLLNEAHAWRSSRDSGLQLSSQSASAWLKAQLMCRRGQAGSAAGCQRNNVINGVMASIYAMAVSKTEWKMPGISTDAVFIDILFSVFCVICSIFSIVAHCCDIYLCDDDRGNWWWYLDTCWLLFIIWWCVWWWWSIPMKRIYSFIILTIYWRYSGIWVVTFEADILLMISLFFIPLPLKRAYLC